MERGEILATADTWRVQIPVNLKVFTRALAEFEESLDIYQQNVKPLGKEKVAHWIDLEYSAMKRGSIQLNSMIDDIYSTITHHRIKKRHIFKYGVFFPFTWLYGVAASLDVEEMNRVLRTEVTEKITEMINVMNEEVSLINATNIYMNELKRELNSQMHVVEPLMKNIKILQGKHHNITDRFGQVVDQMLAADHAIMAMNAFRNAYDFLKTQITSLKQAHMSSMQGKLDPFFFPPTSLLEMVNKIHAERDLLFLEGETGQDSTSLGFYSMAEVSVFSGAESSDLLLDVTFPVTDKKRLFTVFEPRPLPAKLDAKGFFFQINPEADLIAVDKERERYIPMSFSEFSICQGSAVKVCYPLELARREDDEPSCLLKLLKNDDKDIDDLCNVVTMKTFKPRFIKPTPFSDFIYAVPSDTKLDKKCRTEALAREIPDSISGAGGLHVPAGCTVNANGSILFGSTSEIITIELIFDQIKIPQVIFPSVQYVSKQLANLSEWGRLNLEGLFKVDLKKREEVQITIHKMRSELDRIKKLANAWYPIQYVIDNWPFILVSAVSSIGIIVVLYLDCRAAQRMTFTYDSTDT
ncbi:Hypothetical predicted protein [Cloeon dipterum]|uniref:Uncharacterized protein n=1 Tax=Cloeon dipterum TaxID=197152 RepID=A0A8S1DVP2_9INSE|nr:Hypothetical predicted protein [Cloeon dipterum]